MAGGSAADIHAGYSKQEGEEEVGVVKFSGKTGVAANWGAFKMRSKQSGKEIDCKGPAK